MAAGFHTMGAPHVQHLRTKLKHVQHHSMATKRNGMCAEKRARRTCRRKRTCAPDAGAKERKALRRHKVAVEVLQNGGLRAGNELLLTPRLRISDSKRIGHIDAVRHKAQARHPAAVDVVEAGAAARDKTREREKCRNERPRGAAPANSGPRNPPNARIGPWRLSTAQRSLLRLHLSHFGHVPPPKSRLEAKKLKIENFPKILVPPQNLVPVFNPDFLQK